MLKKILLLIIIAMVICTGCISSFAETSSYYHDKYEEEKNKQEQTQQQINEVKGEIDEVLQEVVELNNSILEYETQITNLEEQLDKLSKSITQKEQELVDKKQVLENRLVAMYMKKETTFLDVVLSGELMNFISNQNIIKQAANYDNKLIEEVESLKASLEAEKSETETLKQEKEQKSKQLQTVKAEKEAKMANLTAEQNALQERLASEQAAGEEFARKEREAIAREEAARKEAEKNNSSSNSSGGSSSGNMNSSVSVTNPYSGGKLTWPVPSSSRISSGYGYRVLFGYREFHSGIDIPASLGTNIVAAESGTVIYVQTGYSQNLSAGGMASYGNLMIISHGNGLTTRYAHCNSVYVKVGQSVQKGQVIGAVGTTGCSTGPHLHFEVRQNGSHKNPLNYVK